MPSSPFDDLIGRQIGAHNRYRLERLLGSGGMGAVFLARDTELGKTVAIKFLKENLKHDQECLKRFEREARICVALASESQHIAKIEGYGLTDNGYPYFVMEYLQGQTLAQKLEKNKVLPISQSLDIFRQICLGLKTAHDGVRLWRQGQATEPMKIIHRDLKPENIFLVPTELITSGELVKILDFGIAKVYGDAQYTKITQAGFFLGSCAYASPEQLQSPEKVDERSDIYSLGMLLYRMLSGTDPFALSENNGAIHYTAWCLAHLNTKATPLAMQPAGATLDPRLTALVDRCLSKQPNERFESVDSLLTELKQLAVSSSNTEIPVTQTQPIPLLQTKPVKQSTPPSSPLGQKHRLPQLALGLGLLLAGGMGIGYWWQASVLNEIRLLQTQSQFEQCIYRASNMPNFLPSHLEAQVLLNQCRLALGKQFALDKQYAKAVAVITPIPSSDPSYAEAQRFQKEWSNNIYFQNDQGGVDFCNVPNSVIFECPPAP